MMLTSVYQVKFASAVSCLKPIMSEINMRIRSGVTAASRKEYAQVSADCRAIYCEQRLALILDAVKTKLAVRINSTLPLTIRVISMVYSVLNCLSQSSEVDMFSQDYSTEPSLNVFIRTDARTFCRYLQFFYELYESYPMPASDNFFHAIRYVGQNANFLSAYFPSRMRRCYRPCGCWLSHWDLFCKMHCVRDIFC